MTRLSLPRSAEIVIVGAGGHARVVADIARLVGWTVTAFVDTVHAGRRGEVFCAAPVVDAIADAPIGPGRHAVIAIGDCAARLRMAAALAEAGFDFPRLQHPSAVVARDACIAAGTVVAAGAVVNPGARVGAHAIVNTASSIDHDCAIGDGAHVGPGAHLGGRVVVERGAWVGIGATLRDGVRVGAGSIVGAGAVVVKDVPPGVVVYGIPAEIRRRVIDEAAHH